MAPIVFDFAFMKQEQKKKDEQRRKGPRKNEQHQVKYSFLLLMFDGNCTTKCA
jgi:hypothetical protein